MSVVAAQAVAGGGNVDPIHAVLLHSPEILSHTFLYAASIKDVPAIARTCSNWKSLLSSNTSNVDDIWKNLCSIHHPNLLRLHTLCNFSNNGGNTWRQLLRRRMTSPYEPIGSNRQLQRDLETVFRPEGILAFSNCCGACFDAYEGGKDDDDEDDNETKDKNAFKFREDGGIHFFKLFLNGMNYMGNFHPHRGFAAVAGHAVYKDYWYLAQNWEEECNLIHRWCATLGLKRDEYRFDKPEVGKAVEIHFKKSVALEEPPEDYDPALDFMAQMMGGNVTPRCSSCLPGAG